MALNFGILKPVNIAGQMMAGEQQAQQNQLAQQQNEMRQQEFGMRQQEFATQAEDRKLKLDRANERNVFLTQLSDQMKQGGYTLNRETLGSMMNFGLKSNEESLVNLATKGLQALDEQDQFKTEMGRIVPKPAAVPIQPGALGSGTFGMVPEPTNALAAAPVVAPSTNAMVGGYTRSQVEQMLTNPNARIRDMGKNLLGALPKEVAPVKTIGTVNPGDFTPASVANFNQSGNYADLIPKPTKVAGDGTGVAKAPSGYRVTATGDLEAIPGGPAAGKPLNAAQEIKRRDTLGKEFKSATSALQTTQDVLDSIAFVKSEPGLSRATGFSGQLPSFPEGAAASADVRLANLKGKVTALGKAAAAASGAIGSIATVEWKILSDQIANIDPVKGTGPLLGQLDLVEQQAKGALERIQDGYERQFGEDFERFPQFSNLPPPKSAVKPKTPAPAAAPNIDALVNKYLNPK
jgi:hypothetical protein